MTRFYSSGIKKVCGLVLQSVLCLGFLLGGTGCVKTSEAYRDALVQTEGIEYIYRWEEEKPWSIHIVKIERGCEDIEFVSTLAHDSIIGLATLRDQVEKLQSRDYEPVTAVNGDFFRIRPGLYQGDPLGLQIMEGELISSPRGASFWINAQGKPKVGEVKSKFKARLANGKVVPIEINQERTDDGAVLYSRYMGPSTRTTGGMELILEAEDDSLAADETFSAKVIEIRSAGNSTIEEGRLVLSVGPELVEEAGKIEAGEKMSVSLETVPDLSGVRTAIGGGPILVQKGDVVELKDNPVRHPRTVLGWNDEYYFFAVVDGRQEGLSVGMNYQELSSLMLGLGCSEAINLDGGGSSTFWLKGKVLNSPSDGRERSVANGLAVVRTNKVKE